jgi:hypothetical protein
MPPKSWKCMIVGKHISSKVGEEVTRVNDRHCSEQVGVQACPDREINGGPFLRNHGHQETMDLWNSYVS